LAVFLSTGLADDVEAAELLGLILSADFRLSAVDSDIEVRTIIVARIAGATILYMI
jgi:hypothetical protein